MKTSQVYSEIEHFKLIGTYVEEYRVLEKYNKQKQLKILVIDWY